MGVTEITEGELTFSFGEEFQAVKFDETPFYRNYFGKLPGGKGVDLLSISDESMQFIEIKDCLGYEQDNRERTRIRQSRIASTQSDVHSRSQEGGFDVEIAQKVASTVACLYGAWAKIEGTKCAEQLLPYWEALYDKKIQKDQKRLYIILFLEGDFGSPSTSKKMVMKKIEDSIRQKLSWMKCRVSVVDSHTYPEKLFSVKRKQSEDTH